MSITTPGDLSTLRWMESPLKYHAFYDTKEPICDVYYSALNFKDVMLATANISADLFAGKCKAFMTTNNTFQDGGYVKSPGHLLSLDSHSE